MMMNTYHTYRTTNGSHADPAGTASAAAAAVALSTLVTLLAVAVLVDAAVVDTGFPHANAPCAREVVRDIRSTETQRASSLSRRIVLAARDFLGTNIQSLVAHHHLIEVTIFPNSSLSISTWRTARTGFQPSEVPLDHLLNLPPPSILSRIAETLSVA